MRRGWTLPLPGGKSASLGLLQFCQGLWYRFSGNVVPNATRRACTNSSGIPCQPFLGKDAGLSVCPAFNTIQHAAPSLASRGLFILALACSTCLSIPSTGSLLDIPKSWTKNREKHFKEPAFDRIEELIETRNTKGQMMNHLSFCQEGALPGYTPRVPVLNYYMALTVTLHDFEHFMRTSA